MLNGYAEWILYPTHQYTRMYSADVRLFFLLSHFFMRSLAFTLLVDFALLTGKISALKGRKWKVLSVFIKMVKITWQTFNHWWNFFFESIFAFIYHGMSEFNTIDDFQIHHRKKEIGFPFNYLQKFTSAQSHAKMTQTLVMYLLASKGAPDAKQKYEKTFFSQFYWIFSFFFLQISISGSISILIETNFLFIIDTHSNGVEIEKTF